MANGQEAVTRDMLDEGEADVRGLAGVGTIKGDAKEGAEARSASGTPDVKVDQARLDAEMREREAALGDQRIGKLAEGVHVHTPAGGTTDPHGHGSAHWGEPREDQTDG